MSDTFASLGLEPSVLSAIEKAGYDTPTPIQKKAIPLVLEGHDLLAAAQTGTGKTAAFVIPFLNEIVKDRTRYEKTVPRILILTPTRELAAQVAESIRELSKGLRIRFAVMFGGVGSYPQKMAVSRGVDFLVATPGRLLDMVSRHAVDLSKTHTLILDEADRMLDMGFLPDLKRVVASLPKERQTLLFSATFSPEIKEIAKAFLKDPESVEIERNRDAALVRQTLYRVPKLQKHRVLRDLIVDNGWGQILIFTRTKHSADHLARELNKDGFSALALHSDKTQFERIKALKGFKEHTLPILVATDIAARGLDIEKLPQVVNYELPQQPEDYVHRIGRTGRAGESGEAISLVDCMEMKELRAIERFIKKKLPASDFPGVDYTGWTVAADVNKPRRKGAKNFKGKSGKRAFPGRKGTAARGTASQGEHQTACSLENFPAKTGHFIKKTDHSVSPSGGTKNKVFEKPYSAQRFSGGPARQKSASASGDGIAAPRGTGRFSAAGEGIRKRLSGKDGAPARTNSGAPRSPQQRKPPADREIIVRR